MYSYSSVTYAQLVMVSDVTAVSSSSVHRGADGEDKPKLYEVKSVP